LAGTSGTLSAADIQITSATYTVAASVALPVPFPDETTTEGQAARLQFRQGLAKALNLDSADQITINGVGRRRLEEMLQAPPKLAFVAPPAIAKGYTNDRKFKYLSPKAKARHRQREQQQAEAAFHATQQEAAALWRRRLQDGTAIDYTVTADEDPSTALQSDSFDDTMASAINEAGDALDPVEPDDLSSTVTGVETEITFEVVADSTAGTDIAVEPDDSALATALGSSVTSSSLPLDLCTRGLVIEHSSRHVANACSGSAGAVCDYVCDVGYEKPAGATHVCGGDGAFTGGECLAVGTVVCPTVWNTLTADMIVGEGQTICDSMDLETDHGMPTATIEEVVLAASQKWSHCLLPTCTAPDGSAQDLVDACAAVTLTATSVASECEVTTGCLFAESTLSIASVLCNGGETCGAEFQIGTTTIQLEAVNIADMSEATCSFSVTVSDREPPVIKAASCPHPFVGTVGYPSGWPSIEALDNSGDVEIVASTPIHTGDEELTAKNLPTGVNRFMFTATDSSGNEVGCGADFGLW
jgi:hypothetical protein